jgi:hypothetical protein
LYNGHLSETALIPLTLGAEAALPGWAVMGARLAVRGKVPPPWHSLFHKQGGLDEVRKLWRILEKDETAGRRGGDLDTPTVPLPPNIPRAVRNQLSREEIYELTGAVITDTTFTGGHEPADVRDPLEMLPEGSLQRKFIIANHADANTGDAPDTDA